MRSEFEVWVIDEVTQVVFSARVEIVETDNSVAISKQAVDEMRPNKAGASGDEYSFSQRWRDRWSDR